MRSRKAAETQQWVRSATDCGQNLERVADCGKNLRRVCLLQIYAALLHNPFPHDLDKFVLILGQVYLLTIWSQTAASFATQASPNRRKKKMFHFGGVGGVRQN